MSQTLNPMNTLTPAEAEAYAANGYHVARGLFSPDEIREILTAFMEEAKNGPVEGLSEFKHGSTEAYSPDDPLRYYPRMMLPHMHREKRVGQLAYNYMLDMRIHDILADLLGDEPLAVQTMFYFKPPGARGQDLHQDDFYLRTKPGNCMAAWLAVDDADQDNGGMLCVPGTADYEVQCPTEADKTKFFTTEHVEPPPGTKPVPVNLKAGDVLFFNGRVIHGSYANTSKTRFRRSLIAHYVPEHSTELAHWYRFPTKFDGSHLPIPLAEGGGPCGNLAGASARH